MGLIHLLLLFTAISGQNNPTASPEEKLVRQTYAKLSFETQIDAVHHLAREKKIAAQDAAHLIDASAVTFAVRDVRVGDLREIRNRPYSDFVDRPLYSLSVGGASLNYTNGTKMLVDTYASAGGEWQDRRADNNGDEWNMPMENAIRLTSAENKARFDRYAAYIVTANYRGTSHTYRAMCLFGSNLDSQPTVLFADNAVGTTALMEAWRNDPYPHTLLEMEIGDSPAVQAWLQRTSHSDTCTAGTVCCDENGCALPSISTADPTQSDPRSGAIH
jgi:hypothetical protein